MRGDYAVHRFLTQLGGMGAGYAAAFAGVLRAPFGTADALPDATARQVLHWLAQRQIRVAPAYLPACASDSSLVLLSARGDKLAIGVRQAMLRWRAGEEERALVEAADALVFCGAPNALLAEVFSWRPPVPVMCAPALRNVCDTATPLAELAPGIHYLTMNALEWAQLAHREALCRQVPAISITDGPRGSRIYCGEQEFAIPAPPFHGTANTNRAGETYGSTFFKVLLAAQPDFFRRGRVEAAVALRAGQIATRRRRGNWPSRASTFRRMIGYRRVLGTDIEIPRLAQLLGSAPARISVSVPKTPPKLFINFSEFSGTIAMPLTVASHSRRGHHASMRVCGEMCKKMPAARQYQRLTIVRAGDILE